MTKYQSFIYGLNCPFCGAEIFCRNRNLWKYALIPFLIMLVLYLAFIFLAVPWGRDHCVAAVESWCVDFPGWLQWLAALLKITTLCFVYLLAAALLILLAGPVYELIGGPFFDRMIAVYHNNESGTAIRQTPVRLNLIFLWETLIYGAGTVISLIIGTVLFFALPVIGPLLAVVLISYRLGVNYLAFSGLQHGKTLKMTRQIAGKYWPATLGYGIVVFLIFTIPFAGVFMLPGIITGGAVLFNKLDPVP